MIHLLNNVNVMLTTLGGKIYVGYVSGLLAWISLDAFLDVLAAATVGGTPESLEKMTLVGALVVAVVVLWRSYSASITQNVELTKHLAAQTEVIRQFHADREEVRAERAEILDLVRRDVARMGRPTEANKPTNSRKGKPNND